MTNSPPDRVVPLAPCEDEDDDDLSEEAESR